MEKPTNEERRAQQSEANQARLNFLAGELVELKKAIESKDIIKTLEYCQSVAQLGRPLILAKYKYDREIYNYTRIFNVL